MVLKGVNDGQLHIDTPCYKCSKFKLKFDGAMLRFVTLCLLRLAQFQAFYVKLERIASKKGLRHAPSAYPIKLD